jgi:outer membrane protein TolC
VEDGINGAACLFIMATLVIVPSTPVRAVDQQDLPKQLTLSQAITIALANNSILRTAQSRLEQASGRYAQSRSLLLPSWNWMHVKAILRST